MAIGLSVMNHPVLSTAVRVTDVEPGGIASRWGLRSGDDVLSVDGHAFTDVASLKNALAGMEHNDGTTVTVSRAGSVLILARGGVTEAAPEAAAQVESQLQRGQAAGYTLGATALESARSVEGLGKVVAGFGIAVIVLGIVAGVILAAAGQPAVGIGLAFASLIQGLLLQLLGRYAEMRSQVARHQLSQGYVQQTR